jgi:hypothetical protein
MRYSVRFLMSGDVAGLDSVMEDLLACTSATGAETWEQVLQIEALVASGALDVDDIPENFVPVIIMRHFLKRTGTDYREIACWDEFCKRYRSLLDECVVGESEKSPTTH